MDSSKNLQVLSTYWKRSENLRASAGSTGQSILAPCSPFANAVCSRCAAALSALLVFTLALFIAGPAAATPSCTLLGYNNNPQNKINKLYLYFPLADDPSFPDVRFPPDPSTPAAHKFDVSELTSYMGVGTSAELQAQIFDVVSDDYCEFNVEVIATTTPPPQTFARRNTVAIGTDSMFDADAAEQWGQAQGPDAADQTAVDFARVWAGTYQAGAGQPGGELAGANSTVARWGRAIGGTVAHEAGHNYGLGHEDGDPVGANEDPKEDHLMAEGKVYSDKQRASYRRHFSDHEYSLLASNVGLSVQTMFNWTLVNPNQNAASGFSMHFVSLQSQLSLASVYTGPSSPWAAPALVNKGPVTFRSDPSYFEYEITWSTAKTWTGATPGQVPGGASFSVGVSFNTVDPSTPDAIIIVDTMLFDGTRGPLPLHPRVPGFDAGDLSPKDGTFAVSLVSPVPEPMIVENVTVQFLPRQASIDSMLPSDKGLRDAFELPITVWSEKRFEPKARLAAKLDVRLPIARLRDGRHIVSIIDAAKCGRRDTRGNRPDTSGCKPGINVSLFPATSTLLTVNVVDPKARQWDRQREAYVVAPLKTTIRYQLMGRHPDLNRNGIDDYIDIVTGNAKDRGGDWLIYPLPRRR